MAEQTGLRNVVFNYPVYGVPFGLVFPLLDADGDPISPSSPDSERSLNGDTFADCTNEAVEIATSTGICYLLLTAAEMTADVVAVRVQSTGAKTTVLTLYPRKVVTLHSGTVGANAADGTTLQLAAGAVAIDDYYNGCLLVGTLDSNVEARMITDYVGSTLVATVSPAFVTTPDNNDTYVVYMPDGRQIVQGNLTGIANVAVSTSTAQLGVNVVNAAGTAWGSGAITAASIAADAITNAKIAADAIGAAEIADGAIDANTFAAGAITAAAIATDAIGAAELADGAITAATFAAGAIDATAIANGAIDAATFAAGAIDAAAIADGAIDANTFAAGAINAAAIATDAIGAAELADGAITAATFAAGAIDATAIASDAITSAKIAANAIGSSEIADGAITAAKIATDAIDADAIAADAVTEIQSGLATAAALDAVDNFIDTEIATLTTMLTGIVPLNGTIGATGNDTTHIHLAGIAWGDDGPNSMLLLIQDVSGSIYVSRWIEDFATATDLATVATLPFTPEASVDKYWLLPVRADVTGGSGLDAAGVRAAVGLASANLDTQLADIETKVDDAETLLADLPTNAELATALGTADDAVLAQVALVKAKTDNLPAAPAATGDIPTANQNADALLDRAAGVETGLTPRQALRLYAAALLGKASGLDTTTAVYRDTGDTKDRITATVDADGNRSAVTLDAT